MTDDPRIKVARDLTEIIRLDADLESEAVNHGDDPQMPGGDALAALAPVANLEAWENRYETAERTGADTSYVVDEDDQWEPPLQTLLFWSEQWRIEHDAELDGRRPTVTTEASFIRWALDWAWGNELHFADFAEDVKKARARMEDMLRAGRRNEAGVPCLSCGVDLLRLSVEPRRADRCDGHDGVCLLPHDRCPHDRGGLRDFWFCPECDRRYEADDYYRAVSYSAMIHAQWLPLGEAAERTGVKAGTIRVWVTREKVRRKRDAHLGRAVYHVGDINRHAASDEVAS